MKNFCLRNVSMSVVLTLFVSLFASNEMFAQYVDSDAAVDILVTEVNTLAQNMGSLSDVDTNKLYTMKLMADDIYDNNTSIEDALNIALYSIGYKDPTASGSTVGAAGVRKMSDLPSITHAQFLSIKQDVAALLQ